jgi:aerobic carbon-monoxide dehydrogenase medium subunit
MAGHVGPVGARKDLGVNELMKLPKFDYVKPTTLEEAISFLQQQDAKVLAGGQSLLPMMAYRMASPSLLVDVRSIPELSSIRFGDQVIAVGACVRWVELLKNKRLLEQQPLIAEAVQHIAHYAIRNRGTIGGSLSHADPAAEMPAVALCCDAELRTCSSSGWRRIPISEFLLGPLTTALEPDEILVEVEFPKWRRARKFAFVEFARRKGDFALAGICLALDLDDSSRVTQARVVCFGASDIQRRLSATEAFLETELLNPAVCAAAGELAASEIEAATDIHATAEYRKSLSGTLLKRSLLGMLGEDPRYAS